MNHIEYRQKDIDFSIDLIPLQNEEGILIKCNYSNENKYLSVFNLDKLKNIDKLFGGSPPLSLSEVNQTLCNYFKENQVSIIEVSNSKIIIEIDKDVKPNMRFELEKDQNNFLNYNNNSNDKNYTHKLVNNKNNSNMNYNESMNNNNMNNNENINNNENMNNNNIAFYDNSNYNNNVNCNRNMFNNNINYNEYNNLNNENMNNNNNYNENMNNNINYNENMDAYSNYNMNNNGHMNIDKNNYNSNMNNNNIKNNSNMNNYINNNYNNYINYNENNNNYNGNMNNNYNNNINYNENNNNYNGNMNNNYNNNINYNGNNNNNDYNGNMNNNYNNNINSNGNNNNNYNNNNMNNNMNYKGNNNYNDGMNLNENMNNNSNYYINLNDNMNNNGNYNENDKNKNINYSENNNNNNNYYKNINTKENIDNYNNFNNIDNYKNNNINNYKNNNELLSHMISGGVDNINFSNNNSLKKDNSFSSQKSINSNKNNFNNLNKKQAQNNLSLNVRIARPKNNHIDGPLKNLNCFLKYLLIRKISYKMESISNSKNLISKDVEEVLKQFANINDSKHYKTNILEYLKYLDNIDLDINLLIENLFKERQEQKNEILNYWKYLSKYEEWNKDFGNKFFEDLKNCHFEYSIINMDILERNNPEEYENKKKECKNMKKMVLYLLSEINPDKLNMELKYSNKSTYGKGFYFSDSIDYIARYQNEENIPKIDEYFSLLAFEIFYDEEKLEEFDKNLSSLDLSQNNISNEVEKVEPNGLKKIDLNDNHNIKKNIYTEYVLSEKYQIFPLFTFTLRRNEYFVLYRDPNFIGNHSHSKYLNSLKLRSLKYSHNKNFYFESSTEEALKLLLKKKKEKVILITSIRYDKSGKRFVEIARKILNFDLIVLFFSNNSNHFNWIKDFSNCLYTNKSSIYEEYISNYHEGGLRELKKKVEELYSIKLKGFAFDFLCYSNCNDDLSFSIIDYNNICPYFRSVNIINPHKYLYLSMTTEGKVKKSEEDCLWEITIFDNTITFCSNGFYLDVDEDKGIAVGTKEMKKWNFYIIDESYYFINSDNEKNGILSIEDDDNISINKKDISENTLFKLNDVIYH